MKRHFLKSIAFFVMLMMSVSMWAETYCHTLISNGSKSIYMTCSPTTNAKEYQILFEGTDEVKITGTNLVNVGMNDINGQPGGNALSFVVDATGNGSAKATFTSTTTPGVPYVAALFFATSVGEVAFNPFPTDMDWAACGGDPTPGPTPGPGPEPEPEPTTIDWSTIGWVGASGDKFKVGAVDAANLPGVGTVQRPGWAAKDGIYLTFPAAGITCSHNCAVDGAGICLYIDQFVLKETEVTVSYAGGSKTFYIYNKDGADASADNDAPTMGAASLAEASYHSLTFNVSATDPTTNPVSKFKIGTTTYTAEDGKITVTGLAAGTTFNYDIYAVDDFAHVSENKTSVSGTTLAIVDNEGHLVWNAFNWIGGTNEKYKIGAEDDTNLPGNRNYESHNGHPSLYLTFPAAEIRCSYEFDVLGAGIWLYLDQFTAQETELTVTYAGGSKTFYIYYADGTSPDTEKPTMTSASVDNESITATSVKINVAGTDNVAVAKYVVYNGAEKVGEYEADTNNQIEITGLTPNTAYTYTIKAKDAAKNESEAGINVTFTTSRIMASVCDQALVREAGADRAVNMSCVALGDNNYRITFTSESKMTGCGGTPVQIPGNDPIYLNGGSVSKYLSEDGTIMIFDFTYPIANPGLMSQVYVNFEGVGEVRFTQPTDIIWGACDAAPAPKTASDFALTSEAELTLEIEGTSQIAYTSSSTGAVTYEVNNSNVVVSASGLITAKTAGSAVVTVKQAEDATYQAAQATINITINSPSAVPMGTKEWYAYGSTSTDGQAFTDGYTYHVIATGYEDNATVVVECTMLDEARNPGAMYLHDVKNTSGGYEHAMVRSGKTGTYTFTSTDPLVKGQELQFAVKFEYAGGLSRTEVITYNVGAEQAMPTIEVTSVEITPASVPAMSVAEELDLVAVAKPAIADGRDITWSLESGAGVVELNTTTGHIRALTAGTAVVKAATANGVSATCTITVVAALEPTVVNGEAYAKFTNGLVAVYTYAITRTAERHVVVAATFDRDMTGLIEPGNYELYVNNAMNRMTYDVETKTATLDLGVKADNDVLNLNFRFVLNGDGLAEESVTYTVGSNQAAPATKLVSINDIVENATPAEEVNVVLGRKFVADGGLYTLSLPFAMTAEQIADAFGECYIAQLTSIEERGADMLHLNFSYVEAIEAGVPYLFLPKHNIDVKTIEGVTLNYTAKTSGDALAMMHAVLQPTLSLEEGAYILGADNYLYAVDADKNNGMKGLRAYFTLGSTGSAAPRARVILGPQTTTDMENATINHGAQKVLIDGQLYIIREEGMFNVQGQLVK